MALFEYFLHLPRMTRKSNIILTFHILLFFLLFVACSNGSNASNFFQNNESEKSKKELTLEEQLALKADTALLFCESNKMNTDFCILVDMKRHSGKKRFYVWDMQADTLIASSLCAHGYGQGSTKSKPVFSNVAGSYCTSLGKYKTGIRSYSNYGINVHYKLHGLEDSNNNAFKRIVVLHSYSPVPNRQIFPLHLPLGYSQGCPVIDDDTMTLLDNMFKKQKKPTLLWIYY